MELVKILIVLIGLGILYQLTVPYEGFTQLPSVYLDGVPLVIIAITNYI